MISKSSDILIVLEKYLIIDQEILRIDLLDTPPISKCLFLNLYDKSDLEKNTDLLCKSFNCDVKIIKNASIYNIIDIEIYKKYKIVIWQNTFGKIIKKMPYQTFIYNVQNYCDSSNEHKIKHMIDNNKYIDKYIFASDEIKNSFTFNRIPIINGFVIENQIPPIINNEYEIKGLFVSVGSYDNNTNYFNLVKYFSKLNKQYQLVIYGDVTDIFYYNKIVNYINVNKVSNIKLFEHKHNYLECLKKSEFFILLSTHNSINYYLNEAITLNKKIICTKECLTNSNIIWYPNKVIHTLDTGVLNWFDINKVVYCPYSYFHFEEAHKNILFPFTKQYIGNRVVDDIDCVIDELQMHKHTDKINKNGYTALLRIKNEIFSIKKCVLDIVDLFDEIIIIDNGSTDGTLIVIKELEKLYSNIFVYEYRIDIPRYGVEHIESFKQNKKNTLKNYYNWTASKARYNKKIKWDGDFWCIRNNLKTLMKQFKHETDELSVHFSGITLFIDDDKKLYIKNNSYYNEYRLFLNNNCDIWYDNLFKGDNYCESSVPFTNNIINRYTFSLPVYYETKATFRNEFDSRSTLANDGRDCIDFDIMKKLKNCEKFDSTILHHTNNIYADVYNYYQNDHNNNIVVDTLLCTKNENAQSISHKLTFKRKKSILLLIDIYGWAFHNIAKNIEKYGKYKYDIHISPCDSFYNKVRQHNNISCTIDTSIQFDKVIIFWYGYPALDVLNHFKILNIPVYLALYDYSKWINNQNDNVNVYRPIIDYFFKNMKGYLYSTPIILKTICENIPNLQQLKSYPCYDGVNTTNFMQYIYDDDILTKNKITIGWIGSSDPNSHGLNKGLHIIEKVINKLHNKFIFRPQDSMINKISHDKIPKYLESIDIIVCFSESEGTPNQILEASSCGKCWISTNVGIVNELYKTIPDNPCGMIINRTEKDLETALLYLYDNRNLIKLYGENGRMAIEKCWDWRIKVKQFFSLFDDK
jgi:hypothetical protein